MNELDTKKGFTMEWLEFGGDMNAMFIVAAVAVIGLGIFFFTRKSIE
jgi:LPXTG-motif cell wall-anchored protein